MADEIEELRKAWKWGEALDELNIASQLRSPQKRGDWCQNVYGRKCLLLEAARAGNIAGTGTETLDKIRKILPDRVPRPTGPEKREPKPKTPIELRLDAAAEVYRGHLALKSRKWTTLRTDVFSESQQRKYLGRSERNCSWAASIIGQTATNNGKTSWRCPCC